MQIIRYRNSCDVDIKFLDKYGVIVRNRTYSNFAKGTVRNPYDKTIHGVGYFGEGETVPHNNQEYSNWFEIMTRCYDEKFKWKYPSYYGITTVCDEWCNFQNFRKWYLKNKYDVPGRLHLDKDILVKGNKVYSPDTCILVPQRINMMFMDVSSRKTHDKDLPQGISKTKLQDGRDKYRAMCCGKTIGTFDTLQEATDKYFEKKREHIREVADEYKDIIPTKAYNALLNW